MINEENVSNEGYYFMNYKKGYVLDITIKIIFIVVSFYFGNQIIRVIVEEQNKGIVGCLVVIAQIILITYICIICHEFGHALFLKLYKYDFRYLIIGPILITNNKKYIMKFSKSKFIITGLTISKIANCLNDESDYLTFKKNFKNILLAGTYINIMLIIIGLILFTSKDLKYIGYILVFINITNIVTSIFQNGDIDIVRKLNKEEERVCLYLIEEYNFEKQINRIVELKIMKYIDTKLFRKEYDLDILMAINIILKNKNKIKESDLYEIYKFLEWFKIEYGNILKNGNMHLKLKSKVLMDTLKDLQL